MNLDHDFTSAMQQLHEPAAPASLKANVMARIAREADRADSTGEVATAVQAPRTLPAWLWSVAGVAVVVVASVYGWLATGSLPDLTSPRIGGGLGLIPSDIPAAVALGSGLLLYLAGLLAPLRNSDAGLTPARRASPARRYRR